jgi:anti-sigma regulatory factor (Ser/Thr protein kinase)
MPELAVVAQTSLGPIEIRVPPEPSLSRVLRLAASGVASLAGFTIDEIESIKIAVSEVLIALIEHGAGQPIDVQFSVTETSFDLTARTAVETFNIGHEDLVLCRTVLADVCRDVRIDQVNNEVHIWAAVAHQAIA